MYDRVLLSSCARQRVQPAIRTMARPYLQNKAEMLHEVEASIATDDVGKSAVECARTGINIACSQEVRRGEESCMYV